MLGLRAHDQLEFVLLGLQLIAMIWAGGCEVYL